MAAIYPRKQPLPPNTYNSSTEAPFHYGYEQCLMMELAAGVDEDALVLARCLGYLIRELPNEASAIVANEVIECYADFDTMKTLSQLYINYLIRLFRKNKGRTPVPSEDPSRPSFEMHSAFFRDVAEPAPKDHKTAKRSALKRDNFRCVVTGRVDSVSYMAMGPADLQMYNLHQNPPFRARTNYCHIFPPSTNWSFNPDDPIRTKNKYSGKVWAVIQGFGTIDVLAELQGANIHRLENGFTMEEGLHGLFDDLGLWFEEVAINTYRVHALDPQVGLLTLLPLNHIITFTSTDPSLPLPNPEYLRLHAAVCRVAHLSGAAGYLDLEDREIERLGVLARDGSSADLLTSRLMCVVLKA